MRVLHTADWHIGNFPGPEGNAGENLRALDTVKCIQRLYDIATQEHPTIALVSGDIFHQARVWADRGLAETAVAIHAIEALVAVCPVVVLRGTPNHDGEEQFEMLKTHFENSNGVSVVTEPKVVVINDLQVACLPGFDRGVYRAKHPGLSKEEENQVFTEELGKIVLGLKAQCDPAMPAVLIAHYTVPGCNTESGQTQFLAQFEPVIMPEALDAAAFDLVALGHIHRPQQVTSCQNTFYSGGVNAFNFNDEGQDRGFWIHEIDADLPYDRLTDSRFFQTPLREFLTLRFNSEQIQQYNAGIPIGALCNPISVRDKIVRALYTCAEEDNKALNRAVMEKELMDLGAFWVSEISPEKITVSSNKNELSETTNPEINLINYLNEKAFSDEKIGVVVEAARPIIAEATAGDTISRLSGTFVPLEIEVKNYRNYAEEHFDFADISFCTINGKNGAGKSSLFMDAILDCLFEEPREGDLTGWIRADEKARSGSIAFTFAIGDRVFRVARTRAKSGKATLNLSERVNDDWVNRSAEKFKDTQDIITGILGMDSLTFRSCALIMQDQYGLFLQADKEARMAILGNILGLGVYGEMEQRARLRATEVNRTIAQKQNTIEILNSDVAAAESMEIRFCDASDALEDVRKEIETLSARRDNVNLQLSVRREAAARAERILLHIKGLEERKTTNAALTAAQNGIIKEADAILSEEPEIRSGASKYKDLLEEEKEHLRRYAAVTEKLSVLSGLQAEADQINNEITAYQTEKVSISRRIAENRSKLLREPELKTASELYAKEKQAIAALEGRSDLYISLSDSISALNRDYAAKRALYESEAAKRKAVIDTWDAKARMLNDSHCIDAVNAACVFLADAKKAKAEVDIYRHESTAWKETQLSGLSEIQQSIDTLTRQRQELGFDSEALKQRRFALSGLESDAKEYEQLDSIRQQIALLEERLDSLDNSVAAAAERLSQVKNKGSESKKLADERDSLSRDYTILKGKIAMAEIWLEKEQQLPLAKERRNAAAVRLEELSNEVQSIVLDIDSRSSEYAKEIAQGDEADLAVQLAGLSAMLEDARGKESALQMEIGGLRQGLEVISKKKKEIKALREEVVGLSEKSAHYEILKTAFSQDGVPHSIIRSMLPLLTTTANSILSQMTGGKMGMEFITDKILKSNSKKEIPTLDIVIEEYGKDSLPYLSKSGGEKVKASLSAVLALAEIKSRQAGIQLGMLFIDEPPFLDADGIQAYCDALETIQRRYSNLKVMAITHDPAMKARFPQSIDIIKTPVGSRVEVA